MEKGVTPLCGPWRMWITILPPACGKNLCSINWKSVYHPSCTFCWWKKQPRVRNRGLRWNLLHSPLFTRGGEEVRFSILREWDLIIHSRRGCSDLREWEEGGVTTPNEDIALSNLCESLPYGYVISNLQVHGRHEPIAHVFLVCILYGKGEWLSDFR